MATPTPLGTAAVPAAVVPMRLPATTFELLVAPSSRTPAPVLPEMTFPAPAVAPPIVFRGPPSIRTPSPPLPRGVLPSGPTPM